MHARQLLCTAIALGMTETPNWPGTYAGWGQGRSGDRRRRYNYKGSFVVSEVPSPLFFVFCICHYVVQTTARPFDGTDICFPAHLEGNVAINFTSQINASTKGQLSGVAGRLTGLIPSLDGSPFLHHPQPSLACLDPWLTIQKFLLVLLPSRICHLDTLQGLLFLPGSNILHLTFPHFSFPFKTFETFSLFARSSFFAPIARL